VTITDELQSDLRERASVPIDDGPENWIEARLDLLIAQECFADLDFARWLAARAGSTGPEEADLVSTEAEVGVFDDDERIPVGALGETDVLLSLQWSNGSTSVVLIEDKVWAEFQPAQLERYSKRADATGARCLLIAPAVYLDRVGDERDFVNGVVSIEEIAERIALAGDRRSEWTAAYLLKLIERKSRNEGVSDPATVAFTEYCIEWFAKHAPHVVPHRLSLHTVNQGWLDFEAPAALTYKVVGLKAEVEAMVDLYLDRVDCPAVDLEPGSPGPIDGYVFDFDTVPNRVLRHRCPKLDPRAGAPATDADRAVLHAALAACVRAADWVLGSTESGPTPRESR
jgi:hypothetical protein